MYSGCVLCPGRGRNITPCSLAISRVSEFLVCFERPSDRSRTFFSLEDLTEC
jgi:hypothetical protein